MTNAEFLTNTKKYLEICEYEYFIGDTCERAIKTDLENSKNSDLSEKKQFYLEEFKERVLSLDFILEKLPSITRNHPWISRSKKCKTQIIKLRGLVQNF